MEIREHRLGEWSNGMATLSGTAGWRPLELKESPSQSGGFKPEGLCIHYTAGMSLARAVKTLTNPKRRASAHLVIGRDGEIAQLVPFDRKAWHAGKSDGGNARTFGIELVNAGWLRKKVGVYQTWSKHTIPKEEVVEVKVTPGVGEKRYWQEYTHDQLESLIDVCEALIDEYGVTFITGHSDIAIPEDRKVDPGPAFPMEDDAFQSAKYSPICGQSASIRST